jgi:hypothetical protein
MEANNTKRKCPAVVVTFMLSLFLSNSDIKLVVIEVPEERYSLIRLAMKTCFLPFSVYFQSDSGEA